MEVKNMCKPTNENFQRLNLNLDKQLVRDLDKLVTLSTRYKTRTHIIQDILKQHVDIVKTYNPNLND
jgi:metal-responsive CopG/Arc/MetJ family transcriptional regulator